MNYRHLYHAGNFADVFKHIILIALTKSFLNKETPFCYLETHAGTGSYDLSSSKAQINKEFELGVMKIFKADNPPDLVKEYLDCIRQLNSNHAIKIYPGSPFFVKQFLRPNDRMILCELHPEEYAALKKFFANDKQVAVHHQDGFQGLKAFLPPKERRGFVFIDPPYEKSDEFAQLSKLLPEAVQRWEPGVFVLWYPIKHRRSTDRLIKSVRDKMDKPVLQVELSIYPEVIENQLNGNGMLIVNPPWKLQEQLTTLLPWLWNRLAINHQGRFFLR